MLQYSTPLNCDNKKLHLIMFYRWEIIVFLMRLKVNPGVDKIDWTTSFTALFNLVMFTGMYSFFWCLWSHLLGFTKVSWFHSCYHFANLVFQCSAFSCKPVLTSQASVVVFCFLYLLFSLFLLTNSSIKGLNSYLPCWGLWSHRFSFISTVSSLFWTKTKNWIFAASFPFNPI